MKTQSPDRLMVSVRDACDMLGLGKTTVTKLIGDGVLASGKFGAKRLVSVESIRKFRDNVIQEAA